MFFFVKLVKHNLKVLYAWTRYNGKNIVSDVSDEYEISKFRDRHTNRNSGPVRCVRMRCSLQITEVSGANGKRISKRS